MINSGSFKGTLRDIVEKNDIGEITDIVQLLFGCRFHINLMKSDTTAKKLFLIVPQLLPLTLLLFLCVSF